MTKYRLLKDLPGCKAGETVEIDRFGAVYNEKHWIVGCVGTRNMLSKLPEDWFEEISDSYETGRDWEAKGIKSKLTGLIIAPEDYTEGKKKCFTWDEAMAINVPGWRLPTRSEWTLIAEEFGCDEAGKLSSEKLRRELKLSFDGWIDSDSMLRDLGSSAYYWSSTAYESSCPASCYYLGVDTDCICPGYDNCYDKLTVRLVKEIE